MTTSSQQTPVAQYLRVSTDNQRYSLDNQCDWIEQYAAEHGFVIIQTYADRAKSGLLLKNRPGLKQLLADVTGPRVAYRAILVYDVSRWGRFQDVDEAGHYEFICKHCGIPVHYCAEAFANDGTSVSSIMKALKRTMAAEYSRDLGVRCFAGQKRIAQLGFRSGGAAGYGCRRVLVTPDRRVKQQLERGDRKSVAGDRVLLAPGPEAEVACIRQIYSMFIEKRMSFCAIAIELNRRRVPCIGTTPWTHHRVRAILTNPKYNGTTVYGRTSRRLQTPEIKLPRDRWVVTPHAFEAIIDDATFAKAQLVLSSLTVHKTNDQLLEELRSILHTHGRLTAELIRNTEGATRPGSYQARFGGLSHAYELVGYKMQTERNVTTRSQIYIARDRLMEDLSRLFPGDVSIEGRGGRSHNWLRLKTGLRIVVRSCVSLRTQRGGLRWRVRSDPADSQFMVLLAMMNSENDAVENLVLLPPMSLPRTLDISANSKLLTMGRPVPGVDTFLEILREVGRMRLRHSETAKLEPQHLRATA
jgi:DNA invertase Pin-like site-specific DNA recombinase